VVYALSLTWGMNCGPSAAPRRLEYVTTAHQAGPVGFRDPLGVVSPDGVWVAFISNRHLFLHRIQSATKELLPADNPKRAIAWFPDGRHLAVLESSDGGSPQWFRYDIESSGREPLAVPPTQLNESAKPPSILEKIWGPAVFSPDRRLFYYSIANAQGTLDLWELSPRTFWNFAGEFSSFRRQGAATGERR
jgi:hypothetical protein